MHNHCELGAEDVLEGETLASRAWSSRPDRPMVPSSDKYVGGEGPQKRCVPTWEGKVQKPCPILPLGGS